MKSYDKQNRVKHLRHFHHKVADRNALNKKGILPIAYVSTHTSSNHLFNHKIVKNTNRSLHLTKKLDNYSSVRIQVHSQKGKNQSMQKNKSRNSPTDKYIPYKNDEKIKKIFDSCGEYKIKKRDQSPSFESGTLFLKIQRSKQPSAKLTSLDSTFIKSTGFMMNIKDLRKRNKRNMKNDIMNCRVINLFESIQRTIKPIHKQENNSSKCANISLKQCFGIASSLQQLTQVAVIQKELVHSNIQDTTRPQTYHSKINMTEDNLQPPSKMQQKIGFMREFKQRLKKKIHETKVDTVINSSRKQFELKPWSTQQILLSN